ncbi:MAG: hypothetical protein SGBAC_011039 [Bacillariaceae sp.]
MCGVTVVQDGSSLAFACYDEERNEIILEHCANIGEEDQESLIEHFWDLTKPTLLLLGTKILSNAALLETLTKQPNSIDLDLNLDLNLDLDVESDGELEEALDSASQAPNGAERDAPTRTATIPYRLMKSKSLELQSCKTRILQKLRVLSLWRDGDDNDEMAPLEHMPAYSERKHRSFANSGNGHHVFRPSSYHALAALIDLDSKAQVQALGCLISYLQESVFRLAGAGGEMVTVDRIVLAKSHQYVRVDASTLTSLHIFSTEHHPLQGGSSKEGWSLFSLLDRCKSKGGRKLLKEWMLRPLTCLEKIEQRQDAVQLFLELQNQAGTILQYLAKIGPIHSILLKLQKCSTQPKDFLILIKTLSNALNIATTLKDALLPQLDRQGKQWQYWNSLSERCHASSVLYPIQERIMDVLDEEAMLEQGGGSGGELIIRRGFHPQLDQWKDQYEDLEVTLEGMAEDLTYQFPHLKDLSVVFVPQVALPKDFTLIFSQDGEAFFKCDEMGDLDKNIGDLDGLIKDTEGMIVGELEEAILEHDSELRESFLALAELDCLLAFASCAVDLKFTRPQMEIANHNRIVIQDGRHPLQEITTETEFIPNNVHIDNDNRLVVLSGPNYSGKSCYLRQVGLLVYMAHLGCFIPCSEATISVTNQICARISTVETCAVPQSSFQLDLTNMASILLRATSQSLVLIDEFGKGTSPASGIAILGASLKRLSQIGCRTLCTTHFLEIFSLGVIQDNINGFKARRMAIHIPDNNDGMVVPLFNLEDGVAESSAGLICAKRAGLNPYIVSRAKEIIQTMKNGRQITPLREAAPPEFEVSTEERDMLKHLFNVESWEFAGDKELRTLIQKVSLVYNG